MVKTAKCTFMKVCFHTTPQIKMCKGASKLCAFAINTTDDKVTVSVNERGASGRRLAYAV
jgi:Na+-translocating ferredoxin:NAD+ oxidoreductase RnfD subunit